MNRFVRILCVLALAAVAFGASSCAPASAPSKPGPVPTSSVDTSPTQAGLSEVGDTLIARGWLQEYDIEGGTWVLENLPPTSSAGHAVVVVLVPGTVPLEKIVALRTAGPGGAAPFVEVTGRHSPDASIRMAGPEVMVDSIAVR
jgi:hypothetical protein